MKLPSTHRKLAICLTAAFFWLWPVQGEALDQKTVDPQKTDSAPPSGVISPEEVPLLAADALDFLYSLKTYELSNPEIEAIEKAFPEAIEQIGLELGGTRTMLQSQPTLFALQARQEHWRKLQQKTAGWLRVTTERATQLRDSLHRVQDLRKLWAQTLASIRASNESGPVVQQIESTLTAIEAMQRVLQPRRDAILGLQSRIAGEKIRCDNTIAEIAEAQRKAVSGIMTRGLSIWSPGLWAPTRSTLLARARETANDCWADILQYVRDPTKGMPFQVALFVVLVALFNAAKHRCRHCATEGEYFPPLAILFDRSYASALLVPMTLGASVISPAPPTVRELFQVLAVVPMIRLVQPAIDWRVARWCWMLGGLFALDNILYLFDVAGLVERVILLLEILGGTVVFWKLHVVWGQLHPRSNETVAVPLRAIHMLVELSLVGLVIGLPAMLFGYLPLTRILTSGILAGSVLTMAMYAYVRVVAGLVALAFNSWPLGSLQIVRRFHEIFERRIHRLLVWVAMGAWVIHSLDFVGFLGPTLAIGRAALGARLRIGSVSISVENVIAFVLTLVVAYLLSNFIRFVLHEDLYPRMGVERGLSYAISRLLHYTIVGLGFVVGVAALGVNLTQITVLAGAFGVGIGFGLQSVVNNFVSGLVLLFERPIHVGDSIQAGDLSGEVRRIGARACTVRNSQGGDIIVPNAQLITERVTNWTLSDRLRRIDFPVGLNYGADPRKTIQLLEAVALRQPKVLQHPAPRCFFVGYGDSSMNFQLRAWTDQFDDWQLISSELASAVHDELIQAGLQLHSPQHEVRLLRDAEAGSIPGKKRDSRKKTVQPHVP